MRGMQALDALLSVHSQNLRLAVLRPAATLSEDPLLLSAQNLMT